MKNIVITIVVLMIITLSSSCCEMDGAGASLTIDFIGFTQEGLDSLIIKENADTIKNINGLDNKFNNFKNVGESSYKMMFFGDGRLGNWYFFTNDSTIIDSIVDLQVTRIVEKTGCPSYERHELTFSYDGNDFLSQSDHSIIIQK